MQTSSSQDKDSLTSETSIFKQLKRNLIGKSIHRTSGFTLTELIIVITILSILSVIGFVVMSHQSSVARDGKRISDIKTLSESARITSAQLRKLPTPIADSVSLSVSGSFIGYQGFMSLALVNPLGYGSDKIFDPKDNIPYTYRVNQHYDQAQFMAYLENPRFERSIEITGRKFHGNEKIGMNEGGLDGGGSGRGDDNLNRGNQEVGVNEFGGGLKGIQETASQSLLGTLPSLISQAYAGDIMYPFSTAYALDSSTVDLSSRYPYSAGDRLGIFLSKGSKQPLQNGVTGTGSRDISLSDASTLDIIVGSQGADEYVSMDISTGSLNALKSGTFDEKALLGMNSGTGSGGDGGDSGGGGGLPVSHILTMGEYSVMGNTYYGYIGPLTIGVYAGLGVNITTITPGSLVDDTVDGYVIDTFILDSNYQSPVTILAGATDMPSNITFETPYASIACTPQSSFLDVTPYSCTGSTISTDFYVGSQHDFGITVEAVTPTLITIPTFSSSTAMDSQIQMSWTSIENALSYTLAYSENSGDFIEITGLTSTGYTHSGLQNEALYAYKIKAVFAHGDGEYSGYMYDRPGFPPSIPTNFSANGIGGNSIRLTWDAPPDGQGGFDIEYSTNATDFLSVGNLSGGGGVRMYVHNGLTEGITYHYRIRANKSNWDPGLWSDVVSTIAIGAPLLGTPGNVTDAPINTDIISNTFTASNISTPVPLTVSGAEFRVNGGSWVTSANINNGDQVEYKVSISDYSTTINVEIYFDGQMSSWQVTSVAKTPVPIITGGGGAGIGQNSISWYPGTVQPNTTFTLAWSTSQTGAYTEIANITSVNHYIHTGVSQENTYFYKIKATNPLSGESDYSDTIEAYPSTCFQYQITGGMYGGEVIQITGGFGCGTEITIPEKIHGKNVEIIYDYAFQNKGITSVTIPDNISIWNRAFENNQITSLTLGNGVGINTAVFKNNQIASLDNTNINNALYVGNEAFANNQITSLVVPNVALGSAVFAYNQITSLTIPNGITAIRSGSFGYNQITSVEIPSSVTSIGGGAFRNNQITSVNLPNSIASIGQGAFAYNNLTAVTIPNSVTTIGGDAWFYGEPGAFQYNQINSVVLGNSISSISDWSFGNNLIQSIVIPNTVQYIGASAFRNNELNSIVFSSNMNGNGSIQNRAFSDQTNAAGSGTVYGPSSGYIKSIYIDNAGFYGPYFDKGKLPNYVDFP